jgi:hypothetical protein
LDGSTTLPKFESTMSWPDLQNYGNTVWFCIVLLLELE